MSNRSRTTFQKRQKELLRTEKQREKAANRLARKLAPKDTLAVDSEVGTAVWGRTEPTEKNNRNIANEVTLEFAGWVGPAFPP